MMGWEITLFPRVEVPSLQETLVAEKKLLLFARWLARDYASNTTIHYVGEVKKAHISWLRVPLASMSVVFHRVPMLLRMLKKEKPGQKRVKTPWEHRNFAQIRRAHGSGASIGDFGAGSGWRRCGHARTWRLSICCA